MLAMHTTLASALLAALPVAACSRPASLPTPSRGLYITLVRYPSGGPYVTNPYRITLREAGTAKFEGLGRWAGLQDSTRMTPESVQALATEFVRSGFFDLDSAYTTFAACPGFVTDYPEATLIASRIQGSHRVTFYYGCFGRGGDTLTSATTLLAHLAERVDSVARSSLWIASAIRKKGS